MAKNINSNDSEFFILPSIQPRINSECVAQCKFLGTHSSMDSPTKEICIDISILDEPITEIM